MKSELMDLLVETQRSSSSALIRGDFGPMYTTAGKDPSLRALRHTVVLCQPSRLAASLIVRNIVP